MLSHSHRYIVIYTPLSRETKAYICRYKEQLLQQLQESTQAIIHFTGTNDLSLTCTDFELPGSGTFTRLEWLHLILYHCQRHIQQLKKIIGIVHPTG